MVLELNMQNSNEEELSESEKNLQPYPCVVQYILFPPHATTTVKDSLSEEDDAEFEMAEADGELQLITECWIEPQYGITVGGLPRCKYLQGLDYQQIAKAFFPVDEDCISSLITFHHLTLMCKNAKVSVSMPPVTPPCTPVATSEQRCSQMSAARSTPDFFLAPSVYPGPPINSDITSISFPFDLMRLLPRCQQAELLFSTFIQELSAPLLVEREDLKGPNTILFELLIDMVKEVHDREIPLCEKDYIMFSSLVHERDRDSKIYRVPFPPVPNISGAISSQCSPHSSDQPGSFLKASTSAEPSESVGPFLRNYSLELPYQSMPPKWRCFVKGIDSSHMIITFLPASYLDLQLLVLRPVSQNGDSLNLENLPAKAVRVLVSNANATNVCKETSVFSVSSFEHVKSQPESEQRFCVEDPQNGDVLVAKLEKLPSSEETEPTSNIEQKTKKVINGSVTLPVYVFHCSQSSVSAQLVYQEDGKRWKDIYHDLSFKMDEVNYVGDDSATLKSDTISSGGGSKQQSPEPRSEDSESGSDKMNLKRYCNLLESLFSKCFVHGVYRSLQQGYYINKQDIEAVLDGICREYVLEIDITRFLRFVCGHVKDFSVKANLEKKIKSPTEEENTEISKDYDLFRRSSFPLNLLQLHHPCEHLQQRHTDIKDKFLAVLKQYFKTIPARSDFYYFSPSSAAPMNSVSEDEESSGHAPEDFDNEGSTGDAELQTDTVQFLAELGTKINQQEPKSPLQESDKSSLPSLLSNFESRISQSSDFDDMNSVIENESALAPLFIHLICTLKYKNEIGNCSISSLPTCLDEVIGSLDLETSDLDLNSLQVTLDVLCLTLPPEIECPKLAEASCRTTSFCSSSSPVLDSETFRIVPDDMASISSLHSDFPMCEELMNHLKNLPASQYNVIINCVEKVNWMLQDEIATAALDSYPVTSTVLEMVTEHIINSSHTSCCLTDTVPLQFVFGADNSLDKFIQEFQHMAIPGYHVGREGDYYYLMLDAQAAKTAKQCYSSLVPPLGLASDCLIIPLRNAHADDCAELKKLVSELDSIMGRQNLEVGNETEELKVSSLRDVTTNDETETDDKEEDKRGKFRPSKRTSRERLSREKHSASVPLNFVESNLKDNVGVISPRDSHSAPAKFPIFLRNVASLVDNEDNIDTEEAEEALTLTASANEMQITSGVPAETTENNHDLVSYSSTPVLANKEEKYSSSERTISAFSNNASRRDSIGKELGDIPKDIPIKEHLKERSSSSPPIPTVAIVPFSRDRANSLELPLRKEGKPNLWRRLYVSQCDSDTSTPLISSEADKMSHLGSGQISTTEDGYDGDSSDPDSEWDLFILDSKRPVLPRFWLIMIVHKDHVSVYFHARHQKEENEELKHSKEIYQQTIRVIKNICKLVNQTMLLQNLHDTHMCNQLLVPETSEDIWKSEDTLHTNASSLKFQTMSSIDGISDIDSSYLEATMKFQPGAFDCGVVWQTHFPLHPRLTSGPSRAGVSRGGIHALKGILNSFCVSNRKNMFVYKEHAGSVFYMRLYETTCQGHHGNSHSRTEGDSPLEDSRSSSFLSLHQKKTVPEGDDDFPIGDFRPRLSSQHSDKDQSQDSISITSKASTTKKTSHCIQLHVHGITEVGSEMKEQLVKLMQNRLDESLLDIITAMLARNPMCKLTSEDAQFIQKPGKEPTAVLHFTIHVRAIPFLHAVTFYLHQNLLSFLHNPKYTDTKPENHFRPYPDDSSSSSRLSDDDVFLYFRHQASGTSGSKGLACIILSTVEGQGCPVQYCTFPMPNPLAYKDGLLSFEYDELTYTALFDVNNEVKIPGPLALVRFQIWCVGKVDLDQLTNKLRAAIRHSLWDVVMEYRLLTAPYAECPTDETLFSMSEPTTPVKAARHTGLTVTDHPNDRAFPSYFLSSRAKEFSSSVPELMDKDKTPITSPTDSISFFKFQESSASFSSFPITKSMVTSTPHIPVVEGPKKNAMYDIGDKGTLVSVFHTIMRPFFEFGESIGVPTIQKYHCTLSNRYEIPTILHQFQARVNELSPDVYPKVFMKSVDSATGEVIYIPYNTQTNTNVGNSQQQDHVFITVGRNIIHWRAFMGCSELSDYIESTFSKNQKSYQKFQPFVFGPDKLSESTFSLGITSPMSAPAQGNSPCFESLPPDQSHISFIPRQRLLLLFMQNKDLTLYLYNWTTDVSTSIRNLLCSLVQWNNARSVVLGSILAQKLGLFHNQPLSRATKDASAEKKEVEAGTSSFIPQTQAHVDQLLHNVAPPKSDFHTQRSSTSPSGTLTLWYDKLRDVKPPKPLTKAPYRNTADPVARHSFQLKDIHNSERRSLEDLHRIWQSRVPNIHFMDRQLQMIKQTARLSHFCLTPILFSPYWRWKVAPIRDHTLEPVTIHSSPPEKNAQEHASSTRSRHGSGTSLKLPATEITPSSLPGAMQVSKMRRPSGPVTPSVVSPPSPKPRRSHLDEAWHVAICANYIQEYVQYLTTLGFVAIQTRSQSVRAEKKKEDESKVKAQVVPSAKSSGKGIPTFYLIKCLLGGLFMFQIGFSDPYAYGYLYSLESKRLKTSSTRLSSSQFTMAFLDELDKIKVVMHLHSFTYDYHLRTIHSYISGRQLLFRQGYHLTIFLDDFIKYYQKSPNYARNLIHAGKLLIPNTSMPGQQLYDYIISHNNLYGMTVLRMVPVFHSSDMDTEFAIVELSTYKVSYKDVNEVFQSDNFDVGLLITHDTTANQLLDQNERHVLALNYYILLTSQRDLYPKLNFGPAFGSFRPVRLALSQPVSRTESRKSSNFSAPPVEAFKDFPQDSFPATLPAVNEQRRSSCVGPTMCDEEVTYLGYFSRHETLMLKILQEKADLVHTHLKAIVGRAGVHCCRDFLWNCLFQRGRADDTKDGSTMPMSYADFTELLNLVTSVPLNDVDPELTPFMNMHITWYQSLARLLTTKYSNSCRYFVSPDNSLSHVAITSPRSLDSFMRLSINQNNNRAEMCLVFREPLNDQEHSPEKPNVRVLQLQALVEDFVNACCFHLWIGILS